MEDNFRPLLVAATTEDDDSAMTRLPDEPTMDRKAIAYLLRYETMVRQQEAEHMATLDHLRPLLKCLSDDDGTFDSDSENDDLEREFDINRLRTIKNTVDDLPQMYYLKTDLQLTLALDTMIQKHSTTNTSDNDKRNSSITWAEFLQCYKTIVTGMQTLQRIQDPHLRSRAKHRTLTMISTFGNQNSDTTNHISRSDNFRAKCQPDTSHESTGSSYISTYKKLIFFILGGCIAWAFHQLSPRFVAIENVSSHPSQPPPSPSGNLPIYKESFCQDSFGQDNLQSLIFVASETKIIDDSDKYMKSLDDESRKSQDSKSIPIIPSAESNIPMFSRTRNSFSAALGGLTGALVAPIVWTVAQSVPKLLATIPGWSMSFLAGSILVQGILQSWPKVFRRKER
jgi:hypothetical protein